MALKTTKRTVIILMVITLGMFCFTFALIPLYNVFCKITGLNGKLVDGVNATGARYRIREDQIIDRLVTVEFDVNRNPNLRCLISPQHLALRIKPGALTITSYQVKNLTDKKMVIQAVPSISPGKVAKYLKKLECFCFSPQILKPYESLTLSLKFWLEPEFPGSVHRLTLSYTVFDVTDPKKESLHGT